jgi:hypothetical protein
MTPTLYPHESIIKWFKDFSCILPIITVLVTGVTIITCYVITNAINSVPPLGSYYSQQVTAPMVSVSTPIPIIVGCVFIMIGMYFTFNMLSRGELI